MDTWWLHVEMLWFWNKVLKMDENRITCRIFGYDYAREIGVMT